MRYVLFFIVLFAVVGCKTNMEDREKALPVFDLSMVAEKQVPDTFTWNSIAKRISYIPLSTTPDYLLSSANLVNVGDNSLCLIDLRAKKIFRADKTGKILSSFSKKGNGPGEYAMITYTHENLEDSTITIFDFGLKKCIRYTLDGQFIKEDHLKEKLIEMPLLVTNDYIVARTNEEDKYMLCITDKNLNIKDKIFPVDTSNTLSERLSLIWQLNRSRNRDMAILNYANKDTVFSVTEDGLTPVSVFYKGKYRLPDEKAKNPGMESEPYFKTMEISSLPNHYLISFVFNNVFYDEIWNKETCKIVSRFSNEDGKFGFPFSLPSGEKIRIPTRNLYINKNIVAFSISADIVANEKISGVKDDDNPVLVILEL